MKSKMLSLALAALLVAGTAIPSMAISISSNGENTRSISGGEVGVKKDFGGENTYGFSWIDTDDNSISEWTRVQIGDSTFPKEYGYGYAQSDEKHYPGDVTVSEHHGFGK